MAKSSFKQERHIASTTDSNMFNNLKGLFCEKADTLIRNILSTTQTAIFWKDSKQRFLGVNKAFIDYYGYPDESVLFWQDR